MTGLLSIQKSFSLTISEFCRHVFAQIFHKNVRLNRDSVQFLYYIFASDSEYGVSHYHMFVFHLKGISSQSSACGLVPLVLKMYLGRYKLLEM
jgi:hypothetical protein